jgi:hypothetical protein
METTDFIIVSAFISSIVIGALVALEVKRPALVTSILKVLGLLFMLTFFVGAYYSLPL